MQDQMVALGDVLQAGQYAPQQASQLEVLGAPQQVLFKAAVMLAGKYPDFVGHARGKRADRQIAWRDVDDAYTLTLLLMLDVAEDAALLELVVILAGAQFVKHAARDE